MAAECEVGWGAALGAGVGGAEAREVVAAGDADRARGDRVGVGFDLPHHAWARSGTTLRTSNQRLSMAVA